MRKFFLSVLILALCASGRAAPSALDYPSAWDCNNTKFYWYCKIDEESKQQENKEQAVVNDS